jgi:hypothetical protein
LRITESMPKSMIRWPLISMTVESTALAGPVISFASTAVANIAIIRERNSLIIISSPGEAPIEGSAQHGRRACLSPI